MISRLAERIVTFKNDVHRQFLNRFVAEFTRRHEEPVFDLEIIETNNIMSFNFKSIKGPESYAITVPMPYVERGVYFIRNNNTVRALSNYFIVKTEQELDYLMIMRDILLGQPNKLIVEPLSEKIMGLQKIAYSIKNGNTAAIMHKLQAAINTVVSEMPLHETYMSSFVINHRLMLIDPEFTTLMDPVDRLEYQVEKSKKYFSRGWSTMGLSDGVLADKNYILTYDLRKLTAFGTKFHNPQRNLYSSLKMKGTERPLIQSAESKRLEDIGVYRTGWNMTTLFVNVPNAWEDQLIVDERHMDKCASYDTKIMCYTPPLIKEGDILEYGHKIAAKDDGTFLTFDTKCDSAMVHNITAVKREVGNVLTDAYIVNISYLIGIKDGVKLTNSSANKGVVKVVKDLGTARDPRTGEHIPIDVIVAASSVRKRKNYAQLLEALLNNVNGNTPVVIRDNACPTTERVKERLVKSGFNEDGTMECHTAYGELKGVCGKVFWGMTHDAESTLWDTNATMITSDSTNLRRAGLKLSIIELRALETRFGRHDPEANFINPIIEEILMYSQGHEHINDFISVIRGKDGIFDSSLPVIDFSDVKVMDQTVGIIRAKELYVGTISDTHKFNSPFILKLPVKYEVVVNSKLDIVYEGIPQSATAARHTDAKSSMEGVPVLRRVLIDRLYVPGVYLREPWKHPTGSYGAPLASTLINNVIDYCHRYKADPDDANNIIWLYRFIGTYFSQVSRSLSTKFGMINTLGMSVRYPYSAKAVATLSSDLPKNTVQIHSDMAKILNVSNGDIVIAERFPCMGFMSIRPQKVLVTNNPKCKYTIRVSGNSLGSMTLDFDGDVLYLASFHTKEAKERLKLDWNSPNEHCNETVEKLNQKMGCPETRELTLDDFNMSPFDALTKESHAAVVSKATGVKSHTGPVIALAYNIMRIMESSKYAGDQSVNCDIEYFLDALGNSIFKQKHGVKALHEITVDAICTGNVGVLVREGFNEATSKLICETIAEKASSVGIHDLEKYHAFIKKMGGSNIINKIVREKHHIYFASRAVMSGPRLLNCLNAPAIDVASKFFKMITSGKHAPVKTPLSEKLNVDMIRHLPDGNTKDVCLSLFNVIDEIFTKEAA